MASIKKNKLNNGNITYRIQAKYKDPRTGKFIAKIMTWKRPSDLTEYQVQRELTRVATDFEDKVRKQGDGILADDSDITLMDYADQWLSRIQQNHSYNYYERCLSSFKLFREYFGVIKLNQLTPVMIQNFLDEICSRKIVTKRAKMKKCIQQYLRSHRIHITDMVKMTGQSDTIYQSAQRGEKILLESAEKLCNGLGLNYDEYFETITTERDYAKQTLVKHKRVLSVILATAKRQRLIDHNFASSEYTLPIKGTKQEIRILNDKEAKILLDVINKDENIKRKTSIMITLFMGLRRGELSALAWKDIDFENKTMKIQRSLLETTRFGKILKEPKTETSKRVITIPDTLMNQLIEYKAWWDERKTLFGDVWKDAWLLFTNDNGQVSSPGTHLTWLRKLLKRADLPKVTLHSIRHTNITMQLIAGVDIKTVSVRAGHAKASTTSDFYSHFIKNSDIHASEVIDKIFE